MSPLLVLKMQSPLFRLILDRRKWEAFRNTILIILWACQFATLQAQGVLKLDESSGSPRSSSERAIAEYRQMLQEENPADLYILKGKALWSQPRGPKQKTLKTCDLGLGAGVIQGAWTQLPRYFWDTKRVQDLESRLLSCMQEIQGFNAQELIQADFSSPERMNLSLLAAYVASESEGLPFKVPLSNPAELEMYEEGKKLFYYRAGTHDFSCSTCHSEDARRIRLQELPNLTTQAGAGFAYGTWPAYRISTGSVWTMQQRLADCFRQQRFPKPIFASPATIALSVYLGATSNGSKAASPGLKR